MLTNCLAACAHLTITVSEIQRDICEKNRHFIIPPCIRRPPLGEFPSEYRHSIWGGKTRMVSLPDGEKISKICLFVLTWSTNVTDRQTDRRTLGDSKDRAYALHRAVKTIWYNNIASAIKKTDPRSCFPENGVVACPLDASGGGSDCVNGVSGANFYRVVHIKL